MASSSEPASKTQKPSSASLVSAKGPSSTIGSAPARIVTAALVGIRRRLGPSFPCASSFFCEARCRAMTASSVSLSQLIFDLAPPLAQAGIDRQELQAWLDTWEGPVDRESRAFEISIDGDLAFGHGFFQLSALSKSSGHAVSLLPRHACLRRVAGTWKIVHEHTSVPFYMDGSFRAATDLQP
jgi:PhnB protein